MKYSESGQSTMATLLKEFPELQDELKSHNINASRRSSTSSLQESRLESVKRKNDRKKMRIAKKMAAHDRLMHHPSNKISKKPGKHVSTSPRGRSRFNSQSPHDSIHKPITNHSGTSKRYKKINMKRKQEKSNIFQKHTEKPPKKTSHYPKQRKRKVLETDSEFSFHSESAGSFKSFQDENMDDLVNLHGMVVQMDDDDFSDSQQQQGDPFEFPVHPDAFNDEDDEIDVDMLSMHHEKVKVAKKKRKEAHYHRRLFVSGAYQAPKKKKKSRKLPKVAQRSKSQLVGVRPSKKHTKKKKKGRPSSNIPPRPPASFLQNTTPIKARRRHSMMSPEDRFLSKPYRSYEHIEAPDGPISYSQIPASQDLLYHELENDIETFPSPNAVQDILSSPHRHSSPHIHSPIHSPIPQKRPSPSRGRRSKQHAMTFMDFEPEASPNEFKLPHIRHETRVKKKKKKSRKSPKQKKKAKKKSQQRPSAYYLKSLAPGLSLQQHRERLQKKQKHMSRQYKQKIREHRQENKQLKLDMKYLDEQHQRDMQFIVESEKNRFESELKVKDHHHASRLANLEAERLKLLQQLEDKHAMTTSVQTETDTDTARYNALQEAQEKLQHDLANRMDTLAKQFRDMEEAKLAQKKNQRQQLDQAIRVIEQCTTKLGQYEQTASGRAVLLLVDLLQTPSQFSVDDLSSFSHQYKSLVISHIESNDGEVVHMVGNMIFCRFDVLKAESALHASVALLQDLKSRYRNFYLHLQELRIGITIELGDFTVSKAIVDQPQLPASLSLMSLDDVHTPPGSSSIISPSLLASPISKKNRSLLDDDDIDDEEGAFDSPRSHLHDHSLESSTAELFLRLQTVRESYLSKLSSIEPTLYHGQYLLDVCRQLMARIPSDKFDVLVGSAFASLLQSSSPLDLHPLSPIKMHQKIPVSSMKLDAISFPSSLSLSPGRYILHFLNQQSCVFSIPSPVPSDRSFVLEDSFSVPSNRIISLVLKNELRQTLATGDCVASIGSFDLPLLVSSPPVEDDDADDATDADADASLFATLSVSFFGPPPSSPSTSSPAPGSSSRPSSSQGYTTDLLPVFALLREPALSSFIDSPSSSSPSKSRFSKLFGRFRKKIH